MMINNLVSQENVPKLASTQLFEIASEQRLFILFDLLEQKNTISKMAKKLDATVPEVFRNFTRLSKAGLIKKEADGSYSVTTKGRIICLQLPSLVFLSKNDTYFKEHNLGELQTKFIQRIGALNDTSFVKGYVKVMEYWQDIYNNAQEYIYNILSEVSYTEDLTKPLIEKLKNGIKVNTIVSESVIVPKMRKKIFEKVGFKKFVQEETLQRKMLKDVGIVIVMNESEAGIMFPKDDESDMSKMFYGKTSEFHEWCLDYFNDCWQKATSFQEIKLKS